MVTFNVILRRIIMLLCEKSAKCSKTIYIYYFILRKCCIFSHRYYPKLKATNFNTISI